MTREQVMSYLKASISPDEFRVLKFPAEAITEPAQPEPEPTISFPLKSGSELRAMNICIEWIVENLIPRMAVILLYGRGGIGKTTLIMMLAHAIERGLSIFGMATIKTAVIVVDYENSLAVLSERAKRTGVDGVLFWDSSQTPPSLDKPDWKIYMDLLKQYPGAVFVFDTLRSSHSGDENSSETMTLIMSRLRTLRDAGATVILLHHTPKGNDRQFKGSGAIFDLCDQTLALYQTAKPGSDQEADDDDDDPEKVYRFGTGKKTRYKPHRVFLSFDAEQELFVMAKNPDDEIIYYLLGIVSEINRCSAPKQNEIIKRALEDGEHNLTEKKIRAYLKKGTDHYWTTEKGLQHSIIYRPIESGKTAALYSVAELPNGTPGRSHSSKPHEKQDAKDTPQTGINTRFGKTAEGDCQIAGLSEYIPVFTEADFEGVTP